MDSLVSFVVASKPRGKPKGPKEQIQLLIDLPNSRFVKRLGFDWARKGRVGFLTKILVTGETLLSTWLVHQMRPPDKMSRT